MSSDIPLVPAPDNQGCTYYRPTPESLRQDDNIGLLVKRVHALMHRIIDYKVAPEGLTAMQWRPLMLIRYKGVNTPAELARYMHVDTGAMTRTLDRLEAKGFVTRQRCLDDRRVVNMILTEAGAEVIQTILPAIADTLNLHMKGFSNEETQMLCGLLRRLILNGEHYLQTLSESDETDHESKK